MAMPLRERRDLEDRYESGSGAEQKNERAPVRRERSGTPTRSRSRSVQAPVPETAVDKEKARAERLERISALESKRDELIERLDRGAACIEEARAQGRDVSDWEDYWIQLLRNYEKVCDQLVELAVE
jgi:hypothetical protein